MTKTRDLDKCELLIVGSGPAGLSAAIYAGRAGVETELLGCKPKYAGDYSIDNYYGFPEAISGEELQKRGLQQAERFGVKARCERVLTIHPQEDGSFVAKSERREIQACAIVLATGVSRTKPGIGNLDDYDGKGVSYCVSCDGFFYRQQPVLVVGEGIYAANQALELLQYTSKVAVCLNGKQPTMDASFKAQLDEAGIEVVGDKISRLHGENGLEKVEFEDGSTREAHGLFIAMGEASSTDFAYSLGLEREGVFIKVDSDQKTNLPGVYAAGDCVGGFLQIAVAVGEGAKAAREAIRFIKKKCRAKATSGS